MIAELYILSIPSLIFRGPGWRWEDNFLVPRWAAFLCISHSRSWQNRFFAMSNRPLKAEKLCLLALIFNIVMYFFGVLICLLLICKFSSLSVNLLQVWKSKSMCAVKEKRMFFYEWIIRSGVWPTIRLYFTQSETFVVTFFETSSWNLQFPYLQGIICIREDNLQGCVGVAKYVPLRLTSAKSFATGDLTQGLAYNLQIIFLAILVDTKRISPVAAFDSDHQYLLWERIPNQILECCSSVSPEALVEEIFLNIPPGFCYTFLHS